MSKGCRKQKDNGGSDAKIALEAEEDCTKSVSGHGILPIRRNIQRSPERPSREDEAVTAQEKVPPE